MGFGAFVPLDSSMQLSPNYRLSDLTITNTGLPNEPAPDSQELANLKWLARTLEQLTTDIGPFNILSAFRTPEVQQALADQGEPVPPTGKKSFHEAGMAVDIYPTSMGLDEFYGKLAAAVGTDDNQGPWYGKLSEIAYKPSQNSIHLALATDTKQNVFLALNSIGTYAKLTADEVADYAKPYVEQAIAAVSEAAASVSEAAQTPAGMGVIALLLAGVFFYMMSKAPKTRRATA